MTENKASLIKMIKTVSSKVDLAKVIISISCCFNNIKLSETEITVLAFFMVYGINPQTKILIIKSEVCKNLNNIKTVMVKLKKLDLIYRDELNSRVYINKNLNFNLTSTIGIYLKIDTTI